MTVLIIYFLTITFEWTLRSRLCTFILFLLKNHSQKNEVLFCSQLTHRKTKLFYCLKCSNEQHRILRNQGKEGQIIVFRHNPKPFWHFVSHGATQFLTEIEFIWFRFAFAENRLNICFITLFNTQQCPKIGSFLS